MEKKTKKRVEKIEITESPDQPELSDEDLEEVSGGLGIVVGGVSGAVGTRGMVNPTLQTPTVYSWIRGKIKR